MILFDILPAFEGYLLHEEGLSPATVRQYRADAEKLANWLLTQDDSLSGWEAVGVRQFRLYMQKFQPAPARARRLISSWKKLWKYLQDQEKLNMLPGPGELKSPKLPARLPKFLKHQETVKLLSEAREQRNPDMAARDWAIFAYLYGTGCRISEVLQLTFDQVEFDDALPVLVRIIGKGDKEREVYLSPTAQRALLEWLKIRQRKGVKDSPFVFSHLKGKYVGQPYTSRAIEYAMHRIGERANLPRERRTPHKLRHTYATALHDNGRSLEEIQEALGHQDITTTRIYAQVNRKRVQAAAASLPDVF